MAIEDSVIYDEIVEMANGRSTPTNFVYTCEIIAAGRRHEVTAVNKLDVQRDYTSAYCDQTVLEVEMTGFVYTQFIYPNRSDLRITLNRESRDDKGEVIWTDMRSVSQTFRATLIDPESAAMVDQGDFTDNPEVSAKSSLLSISFQLVDEIIEPMSVAGFNTIFRNVTVEELIKTVLRGKDILPASVKLATGVQMVPPTNTRRYENLIVDEEVALLDLPDYLQKRCGVYAAGLGFYLQRGTWFVYPLKDFTRFNNTGKSLTVVAVESNKMPGSERTFKVDGDQLLVLATGETLHRDLSDAMQRNVGNGIRYLDANRVIDDFSTSDKGRGFVSRLHNLQEYVGWEREDGMTYAPFIHGGPTANHARACARVMSGLDNTVEFEWHHSDPTEIIPGMPVRYLYRTKNEVKAIYGTVIGAVHVSRAIDAGILQKTHTSVSVVKVSLELVK